MVHVLMIIAPHDFRDEELSEPRKLFERAKFKVTLASSKAGEAVGMLGARVHVDTTVAGLRADTFDAVVIVGGTGATLLADNLDVLRIIRDFHSKQKLIAALCLGPVVLAHAGVLDSKKATVYKTPETIHLLESSGAIVVDDDVVFDGLIVTASGPKHAKAFGELIVKMLA